MTDSAPALWVRQLRVHQWAKNLLLLLPPAAAHLLLDPQILQSAVRAVLAFSVLASAVYLLNDIRDVEHDRAHPRKRHRPIAAGRIHTGVAAVVAAVLVVASGLLAYGLPTPFLLVLGVYLALTTAYSLGLKRIVLVDVLVLATLFTLRVVAGAAATGVELSRWFLAFTVFVFLSLALVKRAVELRGLAESVGKRADDQIAAGRGWRTSDLPVLHSLGSASAVAGALVYCLYITSPDVGLLYSRPDLLWAGLPLLLYLLGRIWIGVARDEVREDPVAHAVLDPGSWVAGGLLVLVVLAAS